MKNKQFAVVLSGSGVYDGSEIHEATLTMLAIDKYGGTYKCFAPNVNQYHVINHLTGDEMDETRNVLVESARIARGNIRPLSEFKAADFDALIFPGGFGVAKNLSTFAFKGADCSVNSNVNKVVVDMVEAKKPIGALCIAPAIIVRILKGASVTIGNDKSTIDAIELMGGKHTIKTHGDVTVDEAYKLVTTPCYMLNATISQIAEGADNVVKTIIGM